MFFIRKIFLREYIVNFIQKRDYYNVVKKTILIQKFTD